MTRYRFNYAYGGIIYEEITAHFHIVLYALATHYDLIYTTIGDTIKLLISQ
jgi:hypothetical protein